MDTLTIIFVGAVVLLVAVFVGRQLVGRKQRQRPLFPRGTRPAAQRIPNQVRQVAQPNVAVTVKTEAVLIQKIDLEKAEIVRLRLKLINCFSGNQGAMERSISLEWGKFPNLSEKDLLEKMLYDFGRKS